MVCLGYQSYVRMQVMGGVGGVGGGGGFST